MKIFNSALMSLAVLSISAVTMYAGDITGKISFDGKAPAVSQIKMNADKQCLSMHPNPVNSEEVVVN